MSGSWCVCGRSSQFFVTPHRIRIYTFTWTNATPSCAIGCLFKLGNFDQFTISHVLHCSRQSYDPVQRKSQARCILLVITASTRPFTFIAGSFQARDNIAVFIQWARALGLDQSVLFESSDLVLGKNEKHVLYWCVSSMMSTLSLLLLLIPLAV